MDTVHHSHTSPCQCNHMIKENLFSLIFLLVHTTVIPADAGMLYAVVAHNPSVVHVVRRAGADKNAPQ